jgi:putative oxidoreductase
MAAHRVGDHADPGTRPHTGMTLTVEPAPSRVDGLTRWLARAGVALFFIAIGSEKFGEDSSWIRVFDRIGLGQWFRHFTGVLQVGGALLVLVPRFSLAGIAVLASTMAGAVIVNLFILHTGGAFLLPAALLGGLIAAGVFLRC